MNVSLESKESSQKLLLDILNPLKKLYSEGKADLILGPKKSHYSIQSSYMESFMRPLWGLVPFWAGGGRDAEFEEIYRKGLASGTDPNHPEYWGDYSSCNQRFVEMSAIGYGMIFAKDVLWDPLTEEEKDNLCRYLEGINHYKIWDNNWLLFAVMVNLGLKSVGRPWNREVVEANLSRIDDFYVRNGWYYDGHPYQKDYYIGFVIHFNNLIYARLMEKEDPVRSALYKERAAQFARTFVYWFDEDGDSISYGRSLIYRFAQVSFFSGCLFAGVEPFSVGEMKGIIARHLRTWLSKPVFDCQGVLSVGYGYENWAAAETYGAPGGPYWAMKAFAFLALPDDHPFWQAEELPLPEMPDTCLIDGADMLAKRYPHHTSVFAPGLHSPVGHGQAEAKYAKFVYDTKFSVCLANSQYTLEESAPDCMLAFAADDMIHVRRICTSYEVTEEYVRSVWTPCAGIEVETTIYPAENGHRRVHVITSDRDCEAYDCGFAVDRGIEDESLITRETDDHSAKLRNGQCISSVYGKDAAGSRVITANPNLHLLHEKVEIPAVRYEIKAGKQTIETLVEAWVL